MKRMERTYICRRSGLREKTVFLVADNARPRGKRIKGRSSARKEESNFNQALRRAARILNCNFDHTNGLLVTLDFDDMAMDRLTEQARDEATRIHCAGNKPKRQEAGAGGLFELDAKQHPAIEARVGVDYQRIRELAEHQCKLWLRRIARKADGKLRYLGVSSDMDGRTGELVRAHCHLVLEAPGVSWDTLREAWHLGWIDIRQLRKQRDYTPIAIYLMRQVQRVPDKKKYFVSRGMEQPEIEERIVTYDGEIRLQPGATVLERSEYSEETTSQYVRYLPRRPRKKIGGHKASQNDGGGPVSEREETS